MKLEIVPATGKIAESKKIMTQLNEMSKQQQVMIQIVRSDMVFSELHIRSAIEHAIRAFCQEENITSAFGLEFLLYLAGERQIHKAITKMGITNETKEHIIVLVGEAKSVKKLDGKVSKTLIDSVLSLTQLSKTDTHICGDKALLLRFGISEQELLTLSKDQYEGLILEKVAMVDIIK